MLYRIMALFSLVFLVGCGGSWHTYRPPMADLIGMEANMTGDEIIVGNAIKLEANKERTLTTKSGASKASEINDSDQNIALDLLIRNAKLKLGLNLDATESINANGLEIDIFNNWEWVPEGQTFVYAGIRAETVTMKVTTHNSLNLGEIEYPELGSLKISTNKENSYTIEINNPKIYYKIQLAEVDQTFPGNKYSDGWITMDSLGNTNIPQIELIENNVKKRETWKIQPHQFFWKRWFSSYEMPLLSLLIKEGDLYVRSTRGLTSELIPLKQYSSNGIWSRDSIYLTDFPVGEFERKLIILDLKAEKKGDMIIVKHARIRYPEKKLAVK